MANPVTAKMIATIIKFKRQYGHAIPTVVERTMRGQKNIATRLLKKFPEMILGK